MPKLMLVEDDNNLREIYEARLQAEGYQIVTAKDGEEALVLAKAEKPDLIIADVMMPKISGFEMLDILRNTDGLKQVKVIMLTALGQNDDQKLANRLGADRYLVKSQVTLEDIVKVTHELLGDEPADPAATPPEPAAAETPATDTPAAPVAVGPTPPSTPAAAPAPVQLPPEPVQTPVVAEPPAAPPAPPAVTVDDTAATPNPPAATATADADQASGVISDTAQPAKQEEASMDGRIEDFVAGATEDPTQTVPDAADASAAADDSTPAVQTEPASQTSQPASPPPLPGQADPTQPPTQITPTEAASNAADDDKLVAEAAQKLVDSTTPKEESAASGADQATTPVTPADAGIPKTPDASDGRHVKKVIAPLDDGPKKDLDTLLALEEAKEATTAPVPTPTPIAVADTPSASAVTAPQNPVIQPSPEAEGADEVASSTKPVVTTPNDPGDPGDPNNIAL